VAARVDGLDRASTAAEANSMRLARAFDDPSGAADRRRGRGALGGARAVGFPPARARGPARRLERPAGALGRPGVRDPDAAAVGARDARLPDAARPAAARGGRIVLNSVAVSRSATARVERVARPPRAREVDYRARWIVLATGGVASGGIELDSHWHARETALGLPLHGVPGADEARFGPDYFGEHPFARAGVAVDEGPAPGRRLGRPGRRERPRCGRDPRGRAPVEGEVGRRRQPRQRAPRSRADHGGELMTDVLFEAMRGSLDHCVKCTICETACPFSNVTPLFPGPKYVGPQAERFRTDEPVPDASVDYCSSCGICTQVCPQGVHIAEINTQAKARLREREGFALREQMIAPPDRRRPARHARRADRELDAAQSAVPAG
jgi:ferredoxin